MLGNTRSIDINRPSMRGELLPRASSLDQGLTPVLETILPPGVEAGFGKPYLLFSARSYKPILSISLFGVSLKATEYPEFEFKVF